MAQHLLLPARPLSLGYILPSSRQASAGLLMYSNVGAGELLAVSRRICVVAQHLLLPAKPLGLGYLRRIHWSSCADDLWQLRVAQHSLLLARPLGLGSKLAHLAIQPPSFGWLADVLQCRCWRSLGFEQAHLRRGAASAAASQAFGPGLSPANPLVELCRLWQLRVAQRLLPPAEPFRLWLSPATRPQLHDYGSVEPRSGFAAIGWRLFPCTRAVTSAATVAARRWHKTSQVGGPRLQCGIRSAPSRRRNFVVGACKHHAVVRAGPVDSH